MSSVAFAFMAVCCIVLVLASSTRGPPVPSSGVLLRWEASGGGGSEDCGLNKLAFVLVVGSPVWLQQVAVHLSSSHRGDGEERGLRSGSGRHLHAWCYEIASPRDHQRWSFDGLTRPTTASSGRMAAVKINLQSEAPRILASGLDAKLTPSGSSPVAYWWQAAMIHRRNGDPSELNFFDLGTALRSPAFGGRGPQAPDFFLLFCARVFSIKLLALSSNFRFIRARNVKGLNVNVSCHVLMNEAIWGSF